MAELGPSWITVSLSDSSAVKLVGDWSRDAQSVPHNVGYPETPASAAFTFHGTRARAVGFVTLNDSPLNGWITRGSGEPFGHNVELPACSRRIGYDGPSNHNSGGTTSGTCPPAFYTTGVLACDQYTLNFTVMSDQAMEIKEFDFVPCISDDDQASATATATATTPASTSSPTSVIAAEKKQTLGTGGIVGTVLGALAVLFALGGLALFILLRRRRRRLRRGTSTLPFPSLPPPSPFFISLSRSRPWLRLPGRQPELSTPSAEFLASASSSSPAAASRGGGGGGSDGRTGPTVLYAPIKPWSGSASAAPALAPGPDTTGPAVPMLAGYAGDGYARDGWQHARYGQGIQGETGGKQPLRYGDAEPEPDGLAFARGYLPDSKELMAWQEREQAGARGCAQTPRATEALPRYQTRDSLRWAP